MPLTAALIGEFKQMLEQRQHELREEVSTETTRARGEQFSDIAGPAPDAGDESVATLLTDVDQAIIGRDVQELREIDEALARIDDQSYGICIDCGREIGIERLRVYPIAQRDIHCQTQYEKTYAQQEKPSL